MSSELNQQLRFSIQKLSRRIRSNSANEALSEAQRSVLYTLANHGPQSLGSLSDHEQVTSPSMNRTVKQLVNAGLVSSNCADDDARRLVIDLTEAGREFIAETRRKRDAWFSTQIAKLNAEQQRILDLAAPIFKELADN